MENMGLAIYRGMLSVPLDVSSQMKLTQKLMICHEVKILIKLIDFFYFLDCPSMVETF
jgi:hypothetical protein